MTRSLAAVAAALIALAGCHEPYTTRNPAGEITAKEIAPELRVVDSSTSGSVVVAVSLRATWDIGKVASFTARVTYDSSAMEYVEEVPTADGTLRIVNAERGVIRVAAASAQGMDPSRLALLRFTVRRRDGVDGARLVVEELHDGRSEDLLPRVRVPSSEPRP